MLKILVLSFIGALICTLITRGVDAIVRKKCYEISEQLGEIIFAFIVEFLWMFGFLYCSCKSLTLLTVLIWMWPALLLNLIISVISNEVSIISDEDSIISDEDRIKFGDYVIICVSIITWMASLLGPVQNLIYIHDMSEKDIPYAVTSDEILAKVELTINNSKDFREKYSVNSPEMRKVNGDDIAVYHIKNNWGQNLGNVEYIPGYAIQKSGKLPEMVNKRIYFDTSFTNKRDALRTIRRKYQTEIIGNHKFDLDDDYNPYEIFEYRENLFYSNGNDYGIIILNLVDGTSEKYTVDKIPDWVDFTTTYPR